MTPKQIIEFLLYISFLIPITYHDIREKRIPDIWVLPGIGVLFIAKIILAGSFSIWFLINPAAGFVLIWLLWFISKGRIGLGDAKLMAYISLVTGIFGLFFTLFLASVSGIIFILIKTIKNRENLKKNIPFAPFLVFGGILTYFIKEPVLNVLLSLYLS